MPRTGVKDSSRFLSDIQPTFSCFRVMTDGINLYIYDTQTFMCLRSVWKANLFNLFPSKTGEKQRDHLMIVCLDRTSKRPDPFLFLLWGCCDTERRKTSLTTQSWKNLLVRQGHPSEIKDIQLNVPQSLVFLLGLKKHVDHFNPVGNDLQCSWGLC